MFIRNLDKLQEFTAGDNCRLREFFNSQNDDLDLSYSLAHAEIDPGQETAPHRLSVSEVYYILSGFGEMYIDNETGNVKPGDSIYIPPGSVQKIRNTGDEILKFLCIVQPAWRPEVEEILD